MHRRQLLGHLGHVKINDPNDPKPASRWPCWRQFKTMTQMTQMTQSHADPQPKGILLEGEGVGPSAKGQQKRSVHEQFFIFIFIFCCKLTTTRISAGEQMFHSIPFTPRKVEATESRLKAVYDAAKLGLKGDALALAAGMLPQEYRQLTQLDPVVELAAQKGKADAEIEMANVLRSAALQGDAKSALEVLKHQHGWVAKQAISVEVDQRISITGALAEAQKRALTVEDANIIEAQVHAIDHIQR